MNALSLFQRMLRVPPARSAKPRPPLPPRRRARAAIAWGFAAFAFLTLGMFLVMDVADTKLRDPEYGRRVRHLRHRLDEHPERPFVAIIGSSRASMGIRPSVWEETRPGTPNDPLLFNMSLVGSGPLMELMCLRRLYADGFRPEAVILEYWPPFLREDGPYYEPARIDHARLFDSDRSLVREYWTEAAEVEREMARDRFHPIFRTRHRLIAQIQPRWQPWDKRVDLG